MKPSWQILPQYGMKIKDYDVRFVICLFLYIIEIKLIN
jgi:hypothetical protein